MAELRGGTTIDGHIALHAGISGLRSGNAILSSFLSTGGLYKCSVEDDRIITSTLVDGILDIVTQKKFKGKMVIRSYEGGFEIISDKNPGTNVTFEYTLKQVN